MLEQEIFNIKTEALKNISHSSSIEDLKFWRVQYLGRKSRLNEILKGLKDFSLEKRQKIGPLANTIKKEIADFWEQKNRELERSIDWEKEKIDITAPGKKVSGGHLHILTQVQNEIEDIFIAMGFEIADGPEVEKEYYNFNALNIPPHHPARDSQDTFWLKSDENKGTDKILLRTHTSAAQVRYMEKNFPPFRIIVPGRIFRREATDATHEHTFHQFEALVVGDDVNMRHFKHLAEEFFSRFFGKKIKIRLRPSYFPFVEPGFEFDISCTVCGGIGCAACKKTGWLEVGGAGMVNQEVFRTAGYLPRQYQGFAWGFGIERLAMMKYKIDDVRLFHSGDLRFIRQF